jgi:hypothetical protein
MDSLCDNESLMCSFLADGPAWAWIMLNLLPIETELQYMILTSRSFRIRLNIINDTIDFLLNHQHRHDHNEHEQETTTVTNE